MADIAELGYKVDSKDLSEAERKLRDQVEAAKKAEKATERLERQYASTMKQAKAFGIVLGTLAVGLAAGIIKNTIEAQKVQAQLGAVLKSTGGAAGLTLQQLNDMAGGLQKVTTFGDEAIGTAQGVLLTFTKIGREAFPKALEASLDLATALGMDLKSASLQVGKALNDPVLGVTALSRAGVQFSEDQKAMIKSLVETGRTADAQVIILRELETQMGGSARAARDTLGGALQSLSNAFGDLLEGDSGGAGVRGTTDAINELTAVMQSQQTKEAFSTVVNGLASVTAEIVQGISLFANYIAKVNELRGLATNDTLLDSASYEKINDRLAQVQQRLIDLDKVSEAGVLFNPVTFLSTAAGEDAGAEQARMEAGGFNPYSRSGEIEFLLAERERLIREGSERIRSDIANASGGSTGSPNGRGRGVGANLPMPTDSPDGTNGGAKDRETAATKALKEAERALAEQRRADAELERNRLLASEDYLRSVEDLRAELEGPLAEVQLEYIRREDELIQLANLAGLSNEELASSLDLLEAARLRDVAAINAQADAEKKRAEEQAARAQREAEQPLVDQMDMLRDTTQGFFVDLVKNGKDAIDNLQDYLLSIALESVGKQIAEGLFGGFGATGGGMFGGGGGGGGGGGFGQLLGAFFGGGRALGGDVRGDRMYQVGERDRPELANIGGQQFMIPGDRGTVTPMKDVEAAPTVNQSTVINLSMPGRYDLRTQAQIAADVARIQQKNLARGTA